MKLGYKVVCSGRSNYMQDEAALKTHTVQNSLIGIRDGDQLSHQSVNTINRSVRISS